ncbi:hypothetical protein [Planctomicrobium sp. SH664]|uniref:hypothetical protein n=1 Tax=Planctomicrobium sp. SH664 TaxID=3448125 RepID=UPI003F5BC8EE
MIRFPQQLMTTFQTGFVAVCLLALGGCAGSDGIDLRDLSGRATFDGAPIVYGTIQFVPNAEKNHSGPLGSAEIIDGVYDTRLSGKGIVRGPYLLRVTAFTKRPPPIVDDKNPGPIIPTVFDEYSVEAVLDAETFDFDVPASARRGGR